MLCKGQTASEYLVLLALFLIFVLLVTNPISSLSRVSFLSLDTSTYFSSLPLALEGWVHNGTHAVLFMKNTIGQTATLTKLYLNGTNVLNETHLFRSGESRVIGVVYSANADYTIPFGYEYKSASNQTRSLYTDFPLTGNRGTTTVVVQSGDPIVTEDPLRVSAFATSIARSNFTLANNLSYNITVNNISIDGMRCWVPGSIPGVDGIPVNVSTNSSRFFACNTHAATNASTGYSYTVLINYTNLLSGVNTSLSTVVTGTSSTFACPTNYVPVPGMTLIDGQVIGDFCVMKYEAKAWNLTSGSVDADGYNGGAGYTQWTGTALTNAEPRSEPLGKPWRNINWTDASAECQSLGAGYDILSDPKRMAIAENILRMPINNLNSSASEVRLGDGHNDDSPTGPLATTSANDPVVTSCNRWHAMDNNSNNYSVTCQIRGNGTSAQFGYNGTGNTFAAAYAAGLAGRSQLRTHILSNGYIVWDLSGNVNEWTSAAPTYGSTFDLGGRYTLDSINSSYGGLSFFSEAFLPFPWVQPSRELSQASGAGWYTGYTTPTHEGGFLRGGTWDGDGFFGAGLFSADSYLDRAGFPPYIGFRCAVTP